MNTIAIDCGASFIKAALFSENGEIFKREDIASPEVNINKNFEEIEQINLIIYNIKKIIQDFSEEGKEYNLCISNEMHGFILTDNDVPVTDYISWQKEYGRIKINGFDSVDLIGKNIDSEDIIYTGMPLRSNLPGSNLLYLIHRLDKYKNLRFYTLGDYIIKALSGKEPVCHITNAAATGMCDLRTGNWNEKITSFCSSGKVIFPKIGNDIVSFKFNNRIINAYPAIGDQQAALLGAGLSNDSEVSFNLGTGAQISMLTREVKRELDYQIRPFFYGYYLRTIPHIPSGRALNVYIRFIKDIFHCFSKDVSDDEIWNILISNYHDDETVDMKCDLSFFENAVTDHNKGSLYDIGEYDLTLKNLSNVVFSQMADNYFNIYKKVNIYDKKISRIVFSGGISRKVKPVRDRLIKMLGIHDNYSVSEKETLIGLMKYAEICGGFCGTLT